MIKTENLDVKISHSTSLLPTEESEKERKEAIQKFIDLRRALSWPIDRAPLERSLASRYLEKKKKGKINLPKNFRSDLGNDVRTVWAHDDLNRVVYNWYAEVVSDVPRKIADHPKWINYVTNDGIQSKKHEYIGPAPRVAGYQLGNDGNIQVQFWDVFLQEAWAEKDEWKVEAVQDSRGKWVEL
ncbi:hypothetical protein Clacol_004303 [Clathrus columnatus]|uniref:Uncharacterized protein n=1 Tax=Clathrus columnatus TaxID=1419009 RepID=A0AAV5A956_9AGAM|nr:hypothetical protein Clacol_004303 [Clathrus columnatus]